MSSINKVVTNEITDTNYRSVKFSQIKNLMEGYARRVLGFVIYGPGVLGLLWLIGRFLKR